jgi:hypothetical protein
MFAVNVLRREAGKTAINNMGSLFQFCVHLGSFDMDNMVNRKHDNTDDDAFFPFTMHNRHATQFFRFAERAMETPATIGHLGPDVGKSRDSSLPRVRRRLLGPIVQSCCHNSCNSYRIRVILLKGTLDPV